MDVATKQRIIGAITVEGYDFAVSDLGVMTPGQPNRFIDGTKVVTIDTVTFTATKRTEVEIPQ